MFVRVCVCISSMCELQRIAVCVRENEKGCQCSNPIKQAHSKQERLLKN